jgi:peroxiredoxin
MRILLIALLLTLSFAVQVPDVCANDVGLDIGKSAPSFELRDLSGKTRTLSDYKGSVVLLNFWSTLCAPCTAEMPSLNRLHMALKDKGVIVVAVSIDSSDRLVRDFVREKGISFTVLLDTEKEVFFDQYAGPSLPATYLIDGNGIIMEKFSGPRDWDSRDMIQKILNAAKKQ